MVWLVLLGTALGALVVAAVGGLVVLLVLQRRAARLLGAETPPVGDHAIRLIESRRPTFQMSVEQDFAAMPWEVWSALEDGAFTWIPMIDGVTYRDLDRGPGTVRTLDAIVFAAAEQITRRDPHTRLSVAGIETSIPLLVKSYTMDFHLSQTPEGTTVLRWTIAGRPAVFAFLRLSWTAFFIRPFVRVVLARWANYYR
ncbi:SRPBCC family protein [Nocardia sp. NPDC060249]|uniref:SRPBCC family protein n=1 Tax=Nocardia sp. NPDC060249 TaxID=3347082 RepID=UPI00365936DC